MKKARIMSILLSLITITLPNNLSASSWSWMPNTPQWITNLKTNYWDKATPWKRNAALGGTALLGLGGAAYNWANLSPVQRNALLGAATLLALGAGAYTYMPQNQEESLSKPVSHDSSTNLNSQGAQEDKLGEYEHLDLKKIIGSNPDKIMIGPDHPKTKPSGSHEQESKANSQLKSFEERLLAWIDNYTKAQNILTQLLDIDIPNFVNISLLEKYDLIDKEQVLPKIEALKNRIKIKQELIQLLIQYENDKKEYERDRNWNNYVQLYKKILRLQPQIDSLLMQFNHQSTRKKIKKLIYDTIESIESAMRTQGINPDQFAGGTQSDKGKEEEEA